MKKITVLILCLALVGCVFSVTACKKEEPKETSVERFAASDTVSVPVYEIVENDSKELEASETDSIVRGSSVKVFPTPVMVGDVPYLRIDEGEPEEAEKEKGEGEEEPVSHYLLEASVVDSQEKTVLETTCYVRTSATAYTSPDSPDIASFFKKGSMLEIKDFSNLRDDGTVEMYKLSDGEQEGYVYSKYLVFSLEEADAVNTEFYELNQDKVYDTELYAGAPTVLDYYPYDKTVNTDKVMPAEARTFYLNAGTIDYIDEYIECAKSCGCNAFVIDIKDGGLAYHADVARDYSPTSFERSYNDNDQYKAAVDKVKAAGIWAIGRIVVFNDSLFAQDNPEECIYNNGVNQEWPTAYSRKAWEYNVKLAVSAVEEMGFDEIQFDYVRFPEDTFFMSREGGADFHNYYNEEKSEAIQNFCFYAADNIHKAGAYFSVDVFGECSNGYVTAYGQYWPAISMIVDAISSMPYVDHFGREVDTWSDPYTTVYNWAVQAADAQTITPNPAVARTWLTCYDVPHWDPVITADSTFLGSQVQALWDAGIGQGGFITWNAASSVGKYYEVSGAFSRDYTAN